MARCHIRCWQEAYAHLLSPGFLAAQDQEVDGRTDMWRRALRRGRSPSVAELDGRVIGLAGAVDHGDAPGHPRPLQLQLLYLRRAHQGNGAGQQLLDAQVGDQPAYLWVAQDNPRAQAFYRRNGFRVDGETTVADAWEGMVEARMVRDRPDVGQPPSGAEPVRDRSSRRSSESTGPS